MHMTAGERKESTGTVQRERETPVPGPAGAAGTASLNVSPAMQDLAARRGVAVQDGTLVLPADRYLAAASRLAKEWSAIVPVAIATDRALHAGTAAPATLTPDLLDALLVHDHQGIMARERAKEKDAERERDQKALRTRNVDQDLEASDKKKETVKEQGRNAAGRVPEPALDGARG